MSIARKTYSIKCFYVTFVDDVYKNSSDVRLTSKRIAELELCHSVYYLFISMCVCVCVCARARA